MSLELDSFSKKMTDELDLAIVQKPVSGFFADNNLRGKFVGAKTVLIPEMAVSGLGDYDRDTGFVRGSISVTAKPYTLSMDPRPILPARPGGQRGNRHRRSWRGR